MSEPMVYTGYDENNNAIYKITALDATTELNPAEVQQRVEDVVEVAREEMNNIKKYLSEISVEEKKGLKVKGASFDALISQISAIADKIPDMIRSNIEPMSERAIAERERIQGYYNDDAKAQLAEKSGVVRVE